MQSTANPQVPYDTLIEDHSTQKAYTFVRGCGQYFTKSIEYTTENTKSFFSKFFSCSWSPLLVISRAPLLSQMLVEGIPSENFYSMAEKKDVNDEVKPFATEQEAFEEARRRHPDCSLIILTLNLTDLESQLVKIKTHLHEKKSSIMDNAKYSEKEKVRKIEQFNAVKLSYSNIEKISSYTANEKDFNRFKELSIPNLAVLKPSIKTSSKLRR